MDKKRTGKEFSKYPPELINVLEAFENLFNSLKDEKNYKNTAFEKEAVKFILNTSDIESFSKIQMLSKRIGNYALQKTYAYHLYEFIKTDPRFKIHKHTKYCSYAYGTEEEDWEDFQISLEEYIEIPWGVSFLVEDIKTKINFILSFDFNDTERYVFYHASTDKKKINEINNDFKKYFQKFNIYKNKRVEYAQRGLNFVPDSEITFEDVVLDPSIKQEVHENILGLFDNPKKYKKNNIPLKRGVIFSGPPGCGKSLTINAICNHLKDRATLIIVTSKSIERPNDLSNIYDFARDLAPSLVIFEDVDLLGGDRSVGEFSPYVGELLAQLDGLTSNKGGIVTIASTNHPERLDKALKDRPSRFDRNLPFEMPEKDLRLAILQSYLKNYQYDSNLDFEKIVNELSGFTGAQIKEVVISATLHALNEPAKETEKKKKKSKKDEEEQVILSTENILMGINKSRNKFKIIKKTVGF